MKFYIVDCFAEEKYQGNELLVVIPNREISDWEQQKIAREINFSETAFILSKKRNNGGYDVRIWTPNVGEVAFAGHPTLGVAYVIHHYLEAGKSKEVKLNLKVGQIPVSISENKLFTMHQNPPIFGEIVDRNKIAEVFGINSNNISNEYPIQWVSTGLEAVIIPLKNRESLSQLKMNQIAFLKYTKANPKNYCNHLFFVDMGNNVFSVRCLMEDFVEDPATGSANGNLAGYLIKHKYFNSSEISYTVYQGEDMGRKSVLKIYAKEDEEKWKIEVSGNCYTVASGEWE